MKSWMRDYTSGSVIFQEGEPGNVAFILTEGSVEIAVGSGDKKRSLRFSNQCRFLVKWLWF